MKKLVMILGFGLSTLSANPIIDEYESVQLESLEHAHVSSWKTAHTFRQIENRGKYYGKSRWSTAEGGYQMLSETRSRLIKNIKGITWSNWRIPKNQDRMFHYENKRNIRYIKSWTTDSIYKQYMTWQMGVGGFRYLYEFASNKRDSLYKVSIKTIYRNITPEDKRSFQQYVQGLVLEISNRYGYKLTKHRYKQKYADPYILRHYFKKISQREAGKKWKSYYKNHFKHIYDNAIRHLVIHELNHFKHKVDHYLGSKRH